MHGRRTTILRREAAKLLVLLLAFGVWQPAAFAFKIQFHEQITEQLLQGQGFDADSADEAGDSNKYTDLFEASSDAAHADNNMLDAASERLRTKRTQIGDALNACNRRRALDLLGEALHTTQDIYSHSNSIDNGIAVGDLLSLSRGSAPCSLPNFAPGGLVTGFFNLGGFFTGNQCRGLPANMCCHRDLNKDEPGAPNGGRHAAALDAARGATTTYVNLVLDDIRARFGEPKATQLIKILKKKQRTVYFVIDDTGSMGGDLAGVKASVGSFLDQVVAGDEAPSLGLVSFKDSPFDRGQTCDVATIRAQVNSLFASGGGDCPEASNSAMLTALSHFPIAGSDIQLAGGRLLLATDASAGDAGLGPQVAFEALDKGVSIDAILTGDCVAEEAAIAAIPGGFSDNLDGETAGPEPVTRVVDPLTSRSARTQLRALTDATGGVLFNVARFEVDDVVPTLLELSQVDTAILLSRKLELVAGTPNTLTVPVDETLNRTVTFMITASRAGILPTATLKRPDGSTVAATDPDVRIRTLTSVKSFTVSAPAVGRWKLELAGQGSFAVRAFGATPFRLNSFTLLNPAVTPERPEIDKVPIEGRPVTGAALDAELRFTQGPRSVAIALRQPDGDPIADLTPITPLDGVRRFAVPITIPGEAFLIETTGQSPGGNEFVRQVNLQADPQSIGITATPDTGVAPQGSAAEFILHVQNAGATEATFNLRFVSSAPWPISAPASVTVPAGTTLDVPLSVLVPDGTPEGVRNELTIFAEDQAALRNRNQTKVSVVAGPVNRPPDCGGAAAEPSSLFPPNHDLTPIAITGLTDPDNDPVSFVVTGITQDEPVRGHGSGNTAPDATGVGTSSPSVRAERSGNGSGRVYEIRFKADDGQGGSCLGSVKVGVPHNQHGVAVDDGQIYNSTAPE